MKIIRLFLLIIFLVYMVSNIWFVIVQTGNSIFENDEENFFDNNDWQILANEDLTAESQIIGMYFAF